MIEKGIVGYFADDGNCEVHYADADSGREAAEEYVASGDWGDDEPKTYWLDIRTWRVRLDDEEEEVYFDEEGHTIQVDPIEPACPHEEGHDWHSPWEIFGGLKENPGVSGHGGGVIYNEICRHCPVTRTTDTWAQNPVNGVQGLTSVEYGVHQEEEETDE